MTTEYRKSSLQFRTETRHKWIDAAVARLPANSARHSGTRASPIRFDGVGDVFFPFPPRFFFGGGRAILHGALCAPDPASLHPLYKGGLTPRPLVFFRSLKIRRPTFLRAQPIPPDKEPKGNRSPSVSSAITLRTGKRKNNHYIQFKLVFRGRIEIRGVSN